eukprot:PhM_4_TR10446/c1_g1_i1/m.96318
MFSSGSATPTTDFDNNNNINNSNSNSNIDINGDDENVDRDRGSPHFSHSVVTPSIITLPPTVSRGDGETSSANETVAAVPPWDREEDPLDYLAGFIFALIFNIFAISCYSCLSSRYYLHGLFSGYGLLFVIFGVIVIPTAAEPIWGTLFIVFGCFMMFKGVRWRIKLELEIREEKEKKRQNELLGTEADGGNINSSTDQHVLEVENLDPTPNSS